MGVKIVESEGLLSAEAIGKIIGLDDNLIIDHKEMGKELKVTFFPFEGNVAPHTREFYNKLREAFICNGVSVIPFEESLMELNKRKIRKGIHLIVLGDQDVKNMPAEYLISYDSLILNVIDDDRYVAEDYRHKSFKEQADYGQALLTWHFANFVIGVDKHHWIPYGTTGLNDVYEINYDKSFNDDVLSTVISKMYAPIRPTPLSAFEIDTKGFLTDDEELKPFLDDLVKGSKMFSETNLMDYHYSVSDVKFKKESYRKIYEIMLDHREGIHFGYISRQLPTRLSEVYKLEDAKESLGITFGDKDYTYHNKEIYIKLKVNGEEVCLKVPHIYTLTSVSGTDKVNLEYKNIVKMGLKNGEMSLQFSKDVNPSKGHIRASFDTKVILSNAVATAIYASILKYTDSNAYFPKLLETKGIALAHWHGYVKPELIPAGWEIYGGQFPVFMCSAQQAAVYGFIGKSMAFIKHIEKTQDFELRGDIHVEPDHGVNVTWDSVTGLAEFLISNKDVAKIGTGYFLYIKNYNTIG
jgi:hypothetical protein